MSKNQPKAKAGFEELISTAETELNRLEAGELSLEEALDAYGKGFAAIQKCHGLLKEAQGRVEKLTVRNGEPEVTDLDPETVKERGSPRKAKPAGEELF